MKIKTGTFRRLALQNILDLLRDLRILKIRENLKSDDDFVQTEPTSFLRYYTISDFAREIESNLQKLIHDFPTLNKLRSELQPILVEIIDSNKNAKELLDAYNAVLDIQSTWLDTLSQTEQENFAVTANKTYVRLHTLNENLTLVETVQEMTGNNIGNTVFLRSVCTLMETLRQEERKPTKEEFLAIRVAYLLLLEGKRLVYPYCSWGTSGFRDVQTYMSITDPGEGHTYGTSVNLSLMRGVIVHIEHLERGNDQEREKTEPYRIPAITTIAKVRLHIGSDAPCSSYIGRPVFESDQFGASLLKAVNTISSACTAMFMDGLAECKIAIERMTASEAIKFMQCVVGAVRRDKYSQYLSAAININTPILDDREETKRKNNNSPIWVTDRIEIGILGIELVKTGGFDKVTWDGTGNTYPSICVLEQLSHQQAVKLVHTAHEVGLLTYFSAGFRLHHLPKAVYTGVDGVGVGGAQILRYMDKKTGFHGPFKPENIKNILRIRDEAENEWLGQAALLLSRLDRMFFEGCINTKDNQMRLELFEAVSDQDQEQCLRLINSLNHICRMPPDSDHPVIEWGKRLINAADQNHILAQKKGPQEWSAFLQTIEQGVATRDISLLAEELGAAGHIPSVPLPSLVAITPQETDDSHALREIA